MPIQFVRIDNYLKPGFLICLSVLDLRCCSIYIAETNYASSSPKQNAHMPLLLSGYTGATCE